MAELLLSEVEKKFICEGVRQNFRLDGRDCFDYRKVEIESNVITNCFGSAHIRLGNCDVMASIKVDLIAPDETNEGLSIGRIEFFTDFSANASPFFEGRGGEESANCISQALSTAFEQTFDFASLVVLEGKFAWCLNVDILVLEVGSVSALYDACSIAAKAALLNTKIPEVKIDELGEPQLSDETHRALPLDARRVPLFVTLTRISSKFIVDATPEEEAAGLTSVMFAFNSDGHLLYSKKVSPGQLQPDTLREIMPKLKEMAIKLHEQVNAASVAAASIAEN